MFQRGREKHKDYDMRTKIQFGKSIEYKVASELLREGYDVYMPIADDHGVDIIASKDGGNFFQIQVKALSVNARGGLFAGINHTPAANFFFVFYLEKTEETWIVSSADFIKNASQNKSGKNIGKYSFNVLASKNQVFKSDSYSSVIK